MPDFTIVRKETGIEFQAETVPAGRWTDDETGGVLLRAGTEWTGKGCDFAAPDMDTADELIDAIEAAGLTVEVKL